MIVVIDDKSQIEQILRSLAEVTVNAWPFQWRQVDTSLRIYIYIYTLQENCIALVGEPGRGGGGGGVATD